MIYFEQFGGYDEMAFEMSVPQVHSSLIPRKRCDLRTAPYGRLNTWILLIVHRTLIILLTVTSPIFAGAKKPEAPYQELSLSKLEQRLIDIDSELAGLPSYSLRSGLGSIGYRSKGYKESKQSEWVQIELGSNVPIDQVVLVPTILRDTKEGFIDEGFPKKFKLIAGTSENNEGIVIVSYGPEDAFLPRIAPLVISFPEIEADWVRIEATELSPIGFDGTYFLQLAEVFVFNGLENVALRKPVTISHPSATASMEIGNIPEARKKETLVDGFVPYLMDAAKGDKSIAFVGRAKHQGISSFQIDLGTQETINQIHLHAVEQSATVPVTSSGDIGIPKRLIIEGASQPDFADARLLFDYHHVSFLDAGPIIMLPFKETPCRYVRFTAETNEGNPYDSSTTQRVGFAEIEILYNGENKALRKPVQSDLPPETYHRKIAAITDGHNFYGQILPHREWLNKLARRHDLETERPLVIAELNLRYARQKATLNLMYWITAVLVAGIVFTVLIERIIRLRQLARIRERFAADLHDELGANLHTIGLLGDVAQSSIENPDRLKTALQRSRKITEQTSDAVRHCINLQEANGVYGSLPEDMRRAARRMLTNMEHTEKIENQDLLNDLEARTRADLFLFYKECLVNVCRHAGATQVITELNASKKELHLSVKDNGCGFPESMNDHIPPSLKRRARLLRAQVTTEPSASGGTKIKLSLRLRKFRFRT